MARKGDSTYCCHGLTTSPMTLYSFIPPSFGFVNSSPFHWTWPPQAPKPCTTWLKLKGLVTIPLRVKVQYRLLLFGRHSESWHNFRGLLLQHSSLGQLLV